MRTSRVWRPLLVAIVGGLLLSGCFLPPGGPHPHPGPTATLSAIAVSPADATVFTGRTQQFTATGTYSDGTVDDLTDEVTWTSSAPAASISNTVGSRGLATGTAAGTITITATLSGRSGSTGFTVADKAVVSVAVTPSSATIHNKGDAVRFSLLATYDDGSTDDVTEQATFSDQNGASYITVSNVAGSHGLVTRTGELVVDLVSEDSTVTIVGTLGALSDSADLVLPKFPLQKDAPVITPAPASITTVGGTVQLTLTAHLFGGASVNATEAATWSVAGTGATVSNAPGSKGLVTRTSGSAGSVVVSATYGDVTVTHAVDLPAIP